MNRDGELRADTAPDVTPYLGLRARLSQIWINRWTVLLLLVLVRVVILIGSLDEDIGEAKAKALSACTKVEDIGSAMASMPHYLSVGVNSLAVKGISETMDGLVYMLELVLDGVEGLILFIINFITSTYVCLVAAFIHGGLGVAITVVNEATKVMNEAINTITGAMSNDVASAQDAINKFVNTVSSLTNPFGGTATPPTIDISGRINDLKNIHVDATSFVQDLVKLNQTIPTFDQVQKLTRDTISIPFNLIKKALNDSYSGFAFDESIFPVAEKQALTFCSSNSAINDFFDHLWDIARTAKTVFIVVLSLAAIAACGVMAWIEIKRWHRQQRHARLFSKHGYDSMDVVYIASRPTTATWGIRIASRFGGKRQVLVRWCVAYATSLPAIFVLSLAIAGFFSCLCQVILMKSIEKEVPVLASQVGDFAGEVVSTLQAVSAKWANDTNGAITGVSDTVNKDIFGHVVNATTAVNNTLNMFTNEMNKALDAVFKGTKLEQPIRQVIFCLVGLKIEAVERGLTWVRDHAHVTFPLLPNDTFSLGAQKSISGDSDLTSFLASPSSVTTDEVTEAAQKVVDFLHNNIVQEALISTGLLLVYVIVVLIGVVRAATGMALPGDGGVRGIAYTGDVERPDSSKRSHQSVASRDGNEPRFPQFGGDRSAVTPAADYDYWDSGATAASRDEKVVGNVSSGRGVGVSVTGGEKGGYGHTRSSSYGRFGDVKPI